MGEEMNALLMALPTEMRKALQQAQEGRSITEVRLRIGQPPYLHWAEGYESFGDALSPNTFQRIVSAMMEHSIYVWETEMGQGFFTLRDGSRVGVSGHYIQQEGKTRLATPSALCVRVARAVPGCANELVPQLFNSKGALRSLLLLSAPGAGKTTLLRDIARQLSQKGLAVAIADERCELAACRRGIPTLDVGPHTDVADGLPKHMAMMRLIRSMAPRVIVTDELGDARDVEAVREAIRCGVAVVASAHAGSVEDARQRPSLAPLLNERHFAAIAVVRAIGVIDRLYELHG